MCSIALKMESAIGADLQNDDGWVVMFGLKLEAIAFNGKLGMQILKTSIES
ncbi:MAG: hypothetical protein SWY16_18875 [Cyanobacteriota bacterium]|nr:hypothetical protein [Cyanobacteriota bacterium]